MLYRLIDTETDAELFTYYQVTTSDDVILITSFSAGAEDFEDALAAVNEDVEIDGSPMLEVLDSDDIVDAIAA